MNWSYSGYRQFLKCHRQWYYKNIVAHSSAKDPFRREVTILSKLKTLDAWRGDIVDEVISQVAINKIRKKEGLYEDALIWVANRKFEEKLDFARNRMYRTPNITFSDYGQVSAIIDFDNGNGVKESELKRVRNDIHQALTNFVKREDLIEHLRTASQWLTQRTISLPFSKFRVVARPDLICFFQDEPPHIFDWKVHTFATKTYQEQLLAYAFSLSKVNPHKDFPSDLGKYEVLDYSLTEFQLLTDEIRDYQVSDDDINSTEAEIATGLLRMYRLGANKKFSESTPEDFPTTTDPSVCGNCSFKPICKS
ncbi:hypothetical protein FHS59_000089 [Algoriphagus iocasae]|uniref:PD-(D/E)XK endonuclease-like domain-containing protein n=1 Tax=Algoriphagus iocasae TaxID=1836499 RepID=A0A841MHW0_9BACT|nr:PD-(D/E)XK nuclease family protein [Algoriphagus iocasae]MBB6324474.1 hypothetical protein [Algoriphagus iocasae]